ncbi:MAG: FAD-dependent oxidoreductase [Nanoarchaeota archaeon]
MKIGIVGGGITGLSLAYYLRKNRDNEITIFDKHVGGLLGTYRIGSYNIERYYHHFFMVDKYLINLINELGFGGKVVKNVSRIGFFVNKKTYSFTTPLDLLKFKPLSIADRLRFGFLVIYFKLLKDYSRLVNISARDYLIKHTSRAIYETIWRPLLRIKFGEYADEISAAFIYGRVHPRARSRQSGREVISYLIGSTKVLVDALVDRLKSRNVKFINKDVRAIKEGIVVAGKNYKFDKIIATVPTEIFLKLTGIKYNIKYQAVVCMLLRMRRPLSNIYWMNINDGRIPFGGVIEHTNFISKKYYDNENLAYIFNYTKSDSKIYKMSDKRLFNFYMNGLKLMFPFFKESDVINYYVSRNKYATPVYKTGYKKPSFETKIRNIYMVNTSQIFPDDRNMNNSIKLAKRFVEHFYSKV